jgi:hypothetical protein
MIELCQWYVNHGVEVALLVEDRTERIRVFWESAPVVVQRRGEVIALDEVAPGLRLVVDELFAALDD